ncbi:MAG: GGDEF domain-containing protein [Sedimenticola sp.]
MKSEIERIIGKSRSMALQLDEPNLEGGELRRYLQQSISGVRGALLLSLSVALVSSAMLEPMQSQSSFHNQPIIFSTLTLLSVTAYATSFMQFFLKKISLLMGLGIFGSGALLLWQLQIVSHQNEVIFFAGASVLVMWIYTLSQLDFKIAAMVSWTLTALALLISTDTIQFTWNSYIAGTLLLITTNLISMSSSHNTLKLTLQLSDIICALHEKATTDKVTGTYNRHHLMELSEREYARAKRLEKPISIMLIDIDHFKMINDKYGHIMGDRVLSALAQCLKNNIREFDVCGRYGGDEFMILVTDTPPLSACSVAHRILNCVNNTKVTDQNTTIGFGISIGVDDNKGSEDDRCLEELIRNADAALYEAKIDGRNRIRFSQPMTTQKNREEICTRSSA